MATNYTWVSNDPLWASMDPLWIDFTSTADVTPPPGGASPVIFDALRPRRHRVEDDELIAIGVL